MEGQQKTSNHEVSTYKTTVRQINVHTNYELVRLSRKLHNNTLKVTVMLTPAKGKQKETSIKNLSSILNQATASS
jgi:hypothetical protein